MEIQAYNSQAAIDYGVTWALKRNPRYYNFDNLGGDCTNFISQCLYAGTGIMNYTPTMGWYYYTANKRAPAWTGAIQLYNFLINNKKSGPFGIEVTAEEAEVGDIVQLATVKDDFHHSAILLEKEDPTNLNHFLIATHSQDAVFRPLNSYDIRKIRFIKINGARK